ncbi:hypothetical protein Anas_09879 [Armadillidium nasatum]|uniref:Uncharacterized protein n=1 Tax=Armadillidium nasatum TaxID=96803 RepID=A0A5N5SS40_9CRUS|nr:hypothetical protein Anas_09879 [Armadillidium nasatum]
MANAASYRRRFRGVLEVGNADVVVSGEEKMWIRNGCPSINSIDLNLKLLISFLGPVVKDEVLKIMPFQKQTRTVTIFFLIKLTSNSKLKKLQGEPQLLKIDGSILIDKQIFPFYVTNKTKFLKKGYIYCSFSVRSNLTVSQKLIKCSNILTR